MTILILPFHGYGHFNGLFGIARALQKDHRVVFASISFFRNHVVSKDFEFLTLTSYPFGLGLESWIHDTRKTKNPRWATIVDRWKDTLYHKRKAELTEVLAALRPDRVLVDVQQATDVIVFKAIDPNLIVSLVSVAPPYLLIPGLPPINSLSMPGDDDKVIRRSLKVSLKAIRARTIKQKWKYFGVDDRTIVDRRLRRNGMMDMKDIYPSLIMLAVKGVDQYILTYKEFDFHHPHLDQFHYVGPHPDIQTETSTTNSKESRRKLIYCSFGTVPTQRDIPGFLAKLNEALNGLGYELVVGSMANWVDQRAVLSQAEIFITHGGINSVHDAIRFKVPMIVYPIESNYDQQGNSSRVVYHGLGLRGNIDSETVDGIRRKIREVVELRKNFDVLNISHYTIDNFIKKLLR